ncbi:MAG: AAA family ATPase [Anaerolineaceae bacterium]|nr:AAA family ATPase [Anaerolineaceae bacterium]
MQQFFQSFQEALAKFDHEEVGVLLQTREQERQAILQRFPIHDWINMPLERYALGAPQSEESFCLWLEFNSRHLAKISSRNANKLLIYKRANKPGWYYPSPTFKDENEAWQAIRGNFATALQAAEVGDWEQIDQLPYLMNSRPLLLKILYIYFPNDIIPIFSNPHIRHFMNHLGILEKQMQSWEPVRLNRTLLNHLHSLPEVKDWSTGELERLLYFWSDPRQTRRIVRITTGDDAVDWNDCLDGGYIGLGGDEIGDLNEFESKEFFTRSFSEIYNADSKEPTPMITKRSKELWALYELEPGDIVIATEGLSKILAVGEVTDPGYIWRPERTKLKHSVSVKWDQSYAQTLPSPQQKWALSRVTPVSSTLYQQIVATTTGENSSKVVPVDPLFLNIEKALERKGQAILYGPPGTGKTYVARRFAVWWLLKKQNPRRAQNILTNPDAFLQEEQRLSTGNSSKRVWWVVANPQEWSWDELFKKHKVIYRYGRLQKNYPLVRPGDLVVGYQSRPDKRLVALARVTRGITEVGGEEPRFEFEALQPIRNGPTYEELQNDDILSNSEPMHNRCQGTLFALNNFEAQYLFRLLAQEQPEIKQHFNANEGASYLTLLTFHPSYSYEDFVEGFRPTETSDQLILKMADGVFKRVCREARNNPDKTYLVVIDEINRANLAKVFGELITLLEYDKRDMQITLPQSKEAFTIPPNVYLLGTMNTADRSIKLLDIALRRRFAFFELMPDPELLQGANVNGLALDALLEKLNLSIARYAGREKQLGHALLMTDGEPLSDPDELADRFRQDILPLLQEYCYDDYATLGNYLGKKLVIDNNAINAEVLYNNAALIEALIALVYNQT